MSNSSQTPSSKTGRLRWHDRAQFITPLSAASSPSNTEPPVVPVMSIQSLKSALLDSLFGTERGLTARGETKAEINELISQLESQNPTPSPSESVELLTGNWKLVYTSNSELIALLALSRIPFVTVGDITQKIDGKTAENQIQISVPFSRTSFSTVASLEVRSPTRLQVKFEEGIIRTPELLEDINIPSSISVMGQDLDVSAQLKPIESSVKDAVAQIGTFISRQPDLKIPISGQRAQTWLLTTFLDEDTRIMRGDKGSVYVLVKDVSISTKPVEVVAEEPTSSDS
eukprot:g7048.t2